MSAPNTAKSSIPSSTKANASEQENAHLNSKNAQKTHSRISGTSRGDVRYWLAKVRKVGRSPDYSIQIEAKGRRVRFPLKTSNKTTAAHKALSIYQNIIANGWDTALAVIKPASVKPVQMATVGELIEEVTASTGFRPVTLYTYTRNLRQIAAEIAGIQDEAMTRCNYRTGGAAVWLAKVNAVPLDKLTNEAVNRWSLAHIAKAGDALDAKRRAKSRANSVIRNARALFSAKALQYAKDKLILPSPLPFDGVKLEKAGSARYMSKIDAPTLIAQAQAELTGEPYKIFILGLLCGLRKNEIDKLAWHQVDFTAGQLRIETTENFESKTEDSIDTVDLDNELLDLLRTWKAKGKGAFVVEGAPAPRRSSGNMVYRCKTSFAALYAWLRSKGITALKPLHELRKELGALLASTHGIYVAQRGLRHANISTTAKTYADKKGRISAGLGSLLASNITPFTSGKNEAIRPSRTTPRKARKAQ